MGRMLTDVWPLYGLRVRTPRLELRLPDLAELAALAELAGAGIHDPAVQPFTAEWTDGEPGVVARRVIQHQWGKLAQWQPGAWEFGLVTFLDGQVVGTQGLAAENFAEVREVGTGSWLGREFHGRGIGTEMRAAVLHLIFEGLGAEYALSSSFEDNVASQAVSRRLGYLPDGIERYAIRGNGATSLRWRLDRESWAKARTVPVTIEGLQACLADFGVPGQGRRGGGEGGERLGQAPRGPVARADRVGHGS